MGRKKARSNSTDSDRSNNGRSARSKFEAIDEAELENVTLPSPYPPVPAYPPMGYPPVPGMMPYDPVAFMTLLPSSPPVTTEPMGNPPLLAASPEGGAIPLDGARAEEGTAAAELAETKGDLENGLLWEPSPPKEIIMVTKPGVEVPSIPMDLMELLCAE